MNYSTQLMMALPELILSAGAIALMLVAAWGGQNSTKLVSWAAIAVLLARIDRATPASDSNPTAGRASALPIVHAAETHP